MGAAPHSRIPMSEFSLWRRPHDPHPLAQCLRAFLTEGAKEETMTKWGLRHLLCRVFCSAGASRSVDGKVVQGHTTLYLPHT
jgi:hypothetical protein